MQPIKEPQQSVDTTDNAPAPHKEEVGVVSRWAALIGTVAIGLFYFALPERLTFGPSWLLLAVEAVVILPLLLIRRSDHPLAPGAIRILALVLLGVVTTGLACSVSLLILNLSAEKGSSLRRGSALGHQYSCFRPMVLGDRWWRSTQTASFRS